MKPWLETWEGTSITACSSPFGSQFHLNIETGQPDIKLSAVGLGDAEPRPHALLACAAPEMCRALLAVEWSRPFYERWACPRCGCTQFALHVDCSLDAALTKAGLPDQASRDAARKELGI